MKAAFVFLFGWVVLLSCSTDDNSYPLEVRQVAELALDKPLKFVMDSFRLKADDVTIIEEPSGIISAINVDYGRKGTIKLILNHDSISFDKSASKEDYLTKAANKIIEEVQWKDASGSRGTRRKIIIY